MDAGRTGRLYSFGALLNLRRIDLLRVERTNPHLRLPASIHPYFVLPQNLLQEAYIPDFPSVDHGYDLECENDGWTDRSRETHA